MKRTAVFCICFLLGSPAGAQMCAGEWLFDPAPLRQAGATEAWGERLTASERALTLTGETLLTRPGLWLRAPRLHWDRLSDFVEATGGVEAQTRNWLLRAESVRFERRSGRLEARSVAFQQQNRQLRGEAKGMTHERASAETGLKDARLTTCPLGQDDWFLHAANVRIDRKAQRVYAHHAWLDFKGVPLLYTPYISYPLSDRASGFLMPSFQSYQSPNRDSASWLIGVPYYFNLAPNYDDTLTVYQFQDRGTLLDNEFRSLTRWQRSTLTASWLADEVTGTDRWRVRLDGTQRFGHGLSGKVHWQDISDKDFFTDIPLERRLTTRSFDRREVRLDWRPNASLSAFVRHQDYLLLRNHGTYYELRPQAGLTARHRFSDTLSGQLYTELSQFDIPIEHSRPEGLRTLVRPALTYRHTAPWGELGATVQAQHNRYDLLDGAAGGQFTVPMAQVQGTLVFERPADEIDTGWTQTLEPKLQYTHIPYVAQNALPNFDSGARSLSFNNLFALNRFTGGDRIGDTRRLSAALTTRYLDSRGHERFRAAIGQAFYLATRRVGLTGEVADDTPRSNLFGQLRLTTGPMLFDNTLELTDGSLALRNLISRLRWRSDRLTLLGQYSWQRISQPDERQLLLAGAALKAGRWRLGGYMQYDYIAELKVESAWSLGYESCCWMSELQLEETRLEDGRYNYSFKLVFTLKGLSTTGRSFERLLQRKLNF